MTMQQLKSALYALALVVYLALAPVAFALDASITPEQGKAMVQENKDLFILDVRNPNEYVTGHYPGSVNIPVKELEERYNEIPAGRTILVHCAKGVRAERAYNLLQEKRPDLTNMRFIKGAPVFE